MDYLAILLGLAVGGVIGFLFAHLRAQKIQFENTDKAELIQLQERLNGANNKLEELSEQLRQTGERMQSSTVEAATLREERKQLKRRLEEQQSNNENKEEFLMKEFERIAGKIIIDSGERLSVQSKNKMVDILKPFADRIRSFEKKVEETYVHGVKDRSALLEQIKGLSDLNKQMSEDARSLTNALRQDTRKQGSWGEFILNKILENSGLVEGQEYECQHVTKNEEGATIRPDVVVHLPEKKHLIIDSKVSLTAYNEFVNSDSKEEQVAALKRHSISVRNHIKELHSKNYAQGKGFNSPDFVLMFIPVESSFSALLQADQDIYGFAWDKKIVVVSPTTLLATLRTVSSIWQQEKQNKNVLKIAEQAGRMHDKFVGFLVDMERINKGLGQAQTAYDGALKKLSEGRGNLIVSAKKIVDLGASADKSIPEELLDEASLGGVGDEQHS